MLVLVLNCGRSSIKYQLLDMKGVDKSEVKAIGVIERIGLEEGILTHKPQIEAEYKKYKFTNHILDHEVGISLIMNSLVNRAYGVIEDVLDIEAIGHRVAHGGEYFSKSVLIDDVVKERINKLSLHNPAYIAGIFAMEKLLPNILQVAVFDTSFHQSMPPESFLYAIPYEFYTKHKLRR